MGKQWVRREAKKEAIADTLTKSADWFEENRQQAMAGAGVLLVAILIGGFFAYQWFANQRASWRMLAVAQSLAYQGKVDDAQSQLQQLDRFENSGAWGLGVLLSGDIYYREGQFPKAVDTYRKIVDRQEPKGLVPLALSDEVLAQEAGNNCNDAIETSRRFLDQYKDHYLAPQTNAALARCLQALGRKEEAKSTLQQMTTLYPADQEPYWNQWAQARLKAAS